MANIFQKSLQELGDWLRTPDGRNLGVNPLEAEYAGIEQPPGNYRPLPQGYVSPTNLAAMSQPKTQTSAAPVWNPNAPSPQVPTSSGTTGTWNQPTRPVWNANAPWNQPARQVANQPTGQPVQPQPQPQPQPNSQPFVSMGEQGLNIPNKVTTKIDRPTHSETHSIQAKPPKQIGDADYRNVIDPDARYLQAAAASQGGGAPAGPAPAVRPAQPASQATGPWTYGAPPGQGQGQGQNVNLQVPSHPGLLQRIGQTISHFFGGTLGQHQQPAQQPTSPYRPGYGPPESNALSGVSRALASGRQQVATRGGTPPASAAAPTPNLAYTDTGEPQPLGDTNIDITPTGQAYRADITNPLAYRTSLTPPAGAIGMVIDPQTGQRHWVDKDKKIIQ